MLKMKNLIIASVTMAILTLIGCAKDGATGPQGPAGINGTNGINGNANVKVFYFTNDSLNSTHSFIRYLHIKQSTIDSSLVLAYYVDRGNPPAWYTSPGLGLNNAYQTKTYTYGYTDSVGFYIRVTDPAGAAYTGTVLLDKVKVVVVPGSSFGKQAPVDYNDYRATMRYYGLPE